MYPIIFNYKFITIGSYGLLLGLAFYLPFLFMEREYKRTGIDPDLAYRILITVIPSAIIGAKLFHILENLGSFRKDPMDMIFSGAGLSVYGGFVLSFITAFYLIRKSNEDILKVFDVSAAPMALGYGIGRLGCHVSGDGCYGIPTDSIFGMAYPNGIVPVSVTVYPTPLFESVLSFIFFYILMQLRKGDHRKGFLIFTYLILNGLSRFSVEFIRLNPEILLGLTQAQFVAMGFILAGISGHIYISRIRRA